MEEVEVGQTHGERTEAVARIVRWRRQANVRVQEAAAYPAYRVERKYRR